MNFRAGGTGLVHEDRTSESLDGKRFSFGLESLFSLLIGKK